MYSPVTTKKFEKDYSRMSKRGFDLSAIDEIMVELIKANKLPAKNHDHKLSGNFAGRRECHIKPDWLLIYKIETKANEIIFERTGSHSDLF
jgi:mRNA interferase YafQ